ncbi:hypothetical protein [Pseudomonas syringae group genomosp. 3]|uniref:hypothetical protein n=1 Tax=Pseudomonas syringae group genomosp. 3 TaxID=251701 RepID=UPI0006E54692|nr:hypothetical protein [Pseudomonas syringae group genomosp. 3]KPY19896.1 hypothetical protein ALO54_200178 [Pseudomonas syringae pv. philadelphi]RMP70427.1 putative membrane protein [Pseudomonas syringae pv. berberidis]
MAMHANILSYLKFFLDNILKFSANRFFPYLGISLIGILVANKNFEEFSFFSYVSSAFIFPATIATFTFYAVGNLTPSSIDSKNKVVFNSILFLALVFSSFVVFACFLILIFSQKEISSYPSEYNAKELAICYIVYIFIYVLNSFFNCYYEAWIKDRSSNIGRMVSFIPLIIFAIVAFFLHSQLNYSYFVVVLMTVCGFFELAYYIYISRKNRLFSLHVDLQTMRTLVLIGAPQGLGLALQRLAFFLVNKRLLLIDKDFVSVFSVAISIVSLLAIPVSAFTQIHSIHITRNRTQPLYSYPILLLFGSALPSTILITYFDRLILPLYGLKSELLDQDPWISLGILAMLLSTASLMLITAHLRAYGQSVIPQIIINLSVYGVYVSTVFSGFLDNRPLSYLLFTYAITFLLCLLILISSERINLLKFGVPKGALHTG